LNKDKKLSLLIIIIVVGFSISVLYHYAQGAYFGKPYPYNTFLFGPNDRFNDFYNPVRESADLDPYRPDKSTSMGAYAPFGYFVAYLFSLMKPRDLSLLIFLCAFFVAFILVVKHYLYGLKQKISYHQLLVIFVLVFLTYPVIFAVDRSNFDLIICILIFLFALAYERQRFKASTIFLAMAIAMKPVACVFAIIYVVNKRFKEALLLVFGVIFMSALSLSLFKDGLFVETQKFIASQLSSGKAITHGSVSHFSSDLYNFSVIIVRSISKLFGSGIDLMGSPNFVLFYTLAAVVVFIYFVIYLWEEPKPLWKVLAVLTILLILLPYSSGDYRLTYLFVPMLMYIAINEERRNDLLIVILWGLLLVPKNYYTIGGVDQNIGMVINPLLLVGLLICMVPDAFSIKGAASTLRFVYGKLQSYVWLTP